MNNLTREQKLTIPLMYHVYAALLLMVVTSVFVADFIHPADFSGVDPVTYQS